MKISYNWLKKYIDIDKPQEEIANILTNIGLEVDGSEKIESVKGGLKGLIIGEVHSKEKHPNADRLCITKVNIGNGKLLKIVCGAPNVEVNQKVIVAPIGCTLHHINGKTILIQKTNIRGEESEGMLCAEDEIGLSHNHDGLLILNNSAVIGKPLNEHIKVETDTIFEIGLTPNRGDAASHIGIAKDLAVALDKKLKIPSVSKFKSNGINPIDIIIENNESCLRYSGLTVTGINVKESPDWLKKRLISIGLKPINNIVDVTNFVLHETGQPLHAFDLSRITGLSSGKNGKKVIVKNLIDKTKFITLDGKERELSKEDLMICNEESGMCIAGVFGGIDSGVTENTKAVFLESAYFHPVSIRKSSKRHGLQTDASFRFERGTDPENTVYAIKRAALLIQKVAGGQISDITDVYHRPILPFSISLRYEQVNKIAGITIELSFIKKILKKLDIKILKSNNKILELAVPSAKSDIKREIDVIEEILRFYGYNKIPIPNKMNSSISSGKGFRKLNLKKSISNYLASYGFFEIINNSLTVSSIIKKHSHTDSSVELLNPISKDLETLRNSLLQGGLQSISYNLNRQQHDLKFFEFGKTYNHENGKFIENETLALFVTGNKLLQNAYIKNIKTTPYFIKSHIENILMLGNCQVSGKEANQNDELSFQYKYYNNGHEIAVMGSVSKLLLKQYDIKQDVFFASISWANLLNKTNEIKFIKLPKFPSVKRDIALLIDHSVKYEQIKEIALSVNNSYIKEIHLFDVYEGGQIPVGKKSYAISITLQDNNKTLTDKEVDEVINSLTTHFEKTLGARIR